MPQAAHTRYTFSGVFGPVAQPVEQWSFSLKTAPNVAGAGVNLVDLASALFAAWTENVAPIQIGDVKLTRARYSEHAAGGLVTRTGDGLYRQGDVTGQSSGTQGGVPGYPTSVALAVSLGTPRPGATGKGRFYLPATGHPLGPDYRLSTVHANDISARMAEFVRDLNLIGKPVSVVSSTGSISPVTFVRVGRVLDTMRSRRTSQDEQYIVTAV